MQNPKNWPYRKIASGLENLRPKKVDFESDQIFAVEELNQNKDGHNEWF